MIYLKRKIIHENIGGNLSSLNYSCALRAEVVITIQQWMALED